MYIRQEFNGLEFCIRMKLVEISDIKAIAIEHRAKYAFDEMIIHCWRFPALSIESKTKTKLFPFIIARFAAKYNHNWSNKFNIAFNSTKSITSNCQHFGLSSRFEKSNLASIVDRDANSRAAFCLSYTRIITKIPPLTNQSAIRRMWRS